jgi:hypothetical protein
VGTFTVNAQGQLTAASNTTIAIANTQVSGLGTMSTQNANSVAITGGTINGTSIGATTPSTVTATTLVVNDNTTLGSSNTDTINFVGRVNSDFEPATDNTYDLGRVGHEWRDLYIDGTANIDNLVADTAAITGGTIDNTVIGGTTPAAGTFTTLTATGQTRLGTGVANFFQMDGGNGITSSPTVSLQGSSADITGLFVGKGTGIWRFLTGSTAEQLRVAHTASAVNYVQVTGAATGNAPAISAQGSDTNIGVNLFTKGTGGFNFASNGNSIFSGNGGTHFRVRTDIASASNFWEVFGSSASPILRSTGATQNGLIQSGGTGGISLQTNIGSQTQAVVAHTASAVNFVQVTGAATGATNRPTISAQGSDADINLWLQSKGGATVALAANGRRQFDAFGSATAVNFLRAVGAVSGSAPAFQSQGDDANVDLALTPKGTGNVRFGTFTADMTLTVQGFIEVKDSGGTVRKLAVIA